MGKGVGHLGHDEAMEAGGREFDPRPAHCSRMSLRPVSVSNFQSIDVSTDGWMVRTGIPWLIHPLNFLFSDFNCFF